MPYWINAMLAPTPALAWVFLGLGLPWALVALPRREWRDWPTVACLTLAFGGALVTAWMFVLGTLGASFPIYDGGQQIATSPQPILAINLIMAGTILLALFGWLLVVSRADKPHPLTPSPPVERGENRFTLDEKLLIGLVGVALVVRWLGVAYWPSTAYDALWVYAYEGKLYTLLGYIPNTIGYYPQFLPLLETYMQLAVGGVNDHAARAVLPWLHIGSILAAYVLGRRLFSRRVGIYVAAIWALYPHVGEWSRYGDLEIPVAFLFTAAAAFFLMAWTTSPPDPLSTGGEGNYRRRYAVIAGLLLGVGMWTKPTMGAFIWGVMLLVGIEVARQYINIRSNGVIPIRQTIKREWPRIEVAILTGLASIPLGAAWYVRNVLNGHAPIDLPPGFWQTLAAQSGVEFGWPLLGLLVLVGWVWLYPHPLAPSPLHREGEQGQTTAVRKLHLLIGLGLVLAGVAPSIVSPHRMGVIEWALLAAGAGITFVTLWRWAAERWTDEGKNSTAKLGWGLALALPYFVTWFVSYSYHYRLSFAIVPLMILPTALIVAKWSIPLHTIGKKVGRMVYLIGLVVIAIPGIVSPLYDPNAGWDWLWTEKLPDDHARYESGNAALMSVVDGLQIYLDSHEEPLRVVAPGVKRLPFFFPLEDIRIDEMPTQLSELDGVTYFIYGVPESGGDSNTFVPGSNPVLDVLSIATTDPSDDKSILRLAWWNDDGIFKYSVYELHLDKRWEQPAVTIPPEGDVVFGGFLRFLGYDILSHDFWPGRKVIANLFWEVLEKPPDDYVIYMHLRDKDNNLLTAWDAPITRTADGHYYSSLVWEAGEYIIDRRLLTITDESIPIAADYHVVIGLYDRATETRVPVTIDGIAAGDGFTLAESFSRIPSSD